MTKMMIHWAILVLISRTRNWVRLWTILLTNLVHPVAAFDLVYCYLLHFDLACVCCSILSVRLRILVVTFSDHRKEKSLGLLTQNFVKLFLTMEVRNSWTLYFCLKIHAWPVHWYEIYTWSRLTRSHLMKLQSCSLEKVTKRPIWEVSTSFCLYLNVQQ